MYKADMDASKSNLSDKSGYSVGVIVATYNGEKYIEAQLRSLYEQTRLPDVILVTDAGSSDGTVDICEQFFGVAPGVELRILTNGNTETALGVVDNFEKGLNALDTDYIFFCDQDDVWMPRKIESVVAHMNETDAALCFSNADVVNGSLQQMGSSLWSSYGFCPEMNGEKHKLYLPGEKSSLFSQLLSNNIVTGMTMCMRSSLKTILLPFSKHGYHDAWISILASLFVNVVALNENLVLYRQHDANQEGANRAQKKKNLIQRREKVLERQFFLMDLKSRLVREGFPVPQALVRCIEFEQKRFAMFSELRLPRKKEVNEYRNYYVKPRNVMVKDCIYILYSALRGLHE